MNIGDQNRKEGKSCECNRTQGRNHTYPLVKRHVTMRTLAAEFGVTDRTIRNDITILTAKYPLETSRGVGGGVSIPDSFHPYKNILSMEQVNVLEELMPKANEHQQSIIHQILAAFAPNTYCPCKNH